MSGGSTFHEKSPHVFSLPLQIIQLRPYVSAKVNGHPVSLMLDTGTNRMMITPRLFERLHLKRQKKTVAVIGDGGVEPGVPKITIGSLEIGTIHLENLPALLLGVTSSDRYDGILSLNWLKTINPSRLSRPDQISGRYTHQNSSQCHRRQGA